MSVTTAVTYRVLPDGEKLARAMAEQMLQAAQEAVASRGVARIAISGGNTPKRTFEMLVDPAATEFSVFPWDRTDLFWVDERCVPPDDKESNYRMTRLALLDKAPLAADHIFRIEGELDPELAAARYESAIRNRFRLEGAELPTFDLVALGMGPDGHTASLFPDSLGLAEKEHWVIANWVEKFKTDRITFTFPVLNAAACVVFLASGPDKAAIVRQVLENPSANLPSQLIRPVNGKLLWLLDSAAASALSPSSKI